MSKCDLFERKSTNFLGRWGRGEERWLLVGWLEEKLVRAQNYVDWRRLDFAFFFFLRNKTTFSFHFSFLVSKRAKKA